MVNLLLHICCASCLCAPLEELRGEGIHVHGYFYNPNIHPLLEFRKRLKAVHIFQESDPIEIDYCEEYGLREYLSAVNYEGDNRCEDCYTLRLKSTALHAKKRGFDAFCSTLLFSKQQDHERIKEISEQISEHVGIPFEYKDYRHLCDCSQQIAKKKMLYRQSYCGCIFSEYDRYKDTTRNLYEGWKLKTQEKVT
ncbi:MAG: epoxyqueuosine reductase QueH [Planctomycetota bacterium]|jgi:predicted adenine nucleotide alpha hydrolase (AANH) superfamily ATPase